MKNYVWGICLVAWVLSCLVFTPGASADLLQELEDRFVELHETVGPSVVNIEVKGSVAPPSQQMVDLFRFFDHPNVPSQPQSQQQRRAPRATGSGFIYSKEGYIVTNNHVVEDAESIIVRLGNGHEYNAKVIGRDEPSDLAVIKIEADEALQAVRLGDSDALKVGQFAIALGSPRGFEGSTSFGHVSALGRDSLPLPGLKYQNLIQTDAAINLGNSGGPLCNLAGEVIGINVAIIYGANSIGFAIPINSATSVIPQLIKHGKVIRSWLGVWLGEGRGLIESLGVEDGEGAFVDRIIAGAPAERAGLLKDDVILKVDGKKIKDRSDVIDMIASYTPGSKVDLGILRDRRNILLSVNLEELPADVGTAGFSQSPREVEVLGMRTRAVTPQLLQQRGIDEETLGVEVVGVTPGSVAEDSKLSVGDIITEVDRVRIRSVKEFESLVKEHGEPGEWLFLRYLRGNGDSMATAIRVPK